MFIKLVCFQLVQEYVSTINLGRSDEILAFFVLVDEAADVCLHFAF